MNSFTGYFGLKSVSLVFTIIFILNLSFNAYGAGELDSGFSASAFGVSNGTVNVIRNQPDGKTLIGGQFTELNGFAASGLGRYNADGSIDTTFNAPDFYSTTGVGGTIFAIAVQADGKVLVGGNFLGADNVVNNGVFRLNANGSIDSSFNMPQLFSSLNILDIAVQPDGKILAAVESLVSPFTVRVVRLNTDGTNDGSFTQINFLAKDIALQADGKIVLAGNNLRRFNADGTTDNTFPTINANTIEAVEVRPDGKILFAGGFGTVNNFIQGRIALINPDGTLDLTFNQNLPGANNTITDISLRADGKILIGGGFTSFNGETRFKIARLNADGSLDSGFQSDFFGVTAANLNDVEFLPDGRTLFGTVAATTANTTLIRLNADGTTDTSFLSYVTRVAVVRRVLQQPDGKILAAGAFTLANNVRRLSIARFNADGSLDTSFVPYFNNLIPPLPSFSAMALQSDGKILVGTTLTGSNIILKRLNADGSEDTSFSTAFTGSVTDIVVLPNGQILVSGETAGGITKYVTKLNSNGTTDTSFGTATSNQLVYKILVQPDGKILVGGIFSSIRGVSRGFIARLNADGTLDSTFNPPTGANNAITGMDLQSDGKIVVGGSFSSLNGISSPYIGRLNANGTTDTSFASSTNGAVFAIKIQPDNKILIGGNMSAVQGAPHNGIARLNANGAVDNGFNTFANTSVQDIKLQSDGKILIGGLFTKLNRLSAVRIGRLLNQFATPRTLFDYDGDGRADVSVFRPSENRWYIFRSSDGVISQQVFAVAGDKPVPADFDGDGKTDLTVFRANGDWWSLSSSNNSQISTNLGDAADYKLPSDFDGDGRADYVIFRPSNNVWYRLSSANGLSSNRTFGLAGDKPITGDFDGDGKSDVAIFRPSTGDWWWQSSVDNIQRATRWGISTDIPTPADFDGDGKTDFAVYRPSTGVWYVINSNNGSFTIMSFGLSEDKPVAADYDGDGKADIAVFRPSTGIWYLMRSTAGFTALQFGVSTDIPTQNVFVP